MSAFATDSRFHYGQKISSPRVYRRQVHHFPASPIRGNFASSRSKRTVYIDVTIHVTGSARISVFFTPSTLSHLTFCDVVSRQGLSLAVGWCADHAIQLSEFLSPQPRSNAALFALTRANLRVTTNAVVSVQLSQRTFRHRAFVECVMAQLFDGAVQMYVVTLDQQGNGGIKPDIVVRSLRCFHGIADMVKETHNMQGGLQLLSEQLKTLINAA